MCNLSPIGAAFSEIGRAITKEHQEYSVTQTQYFMIYELFCLKKSPVETLNHYDPLKKHMILQKCISWLC